MEIFQRLHACGCSLAHHDQDACCPNCNSLPRLALQQILAWQHFPYPLAPLPSLLFFCLQRIPSPRNFCCLQSTWDQLLPCLQSAKDLPRFSSLACLNQFFESLTPHLFCQTLTVQRLQRIPCPRHGCCSRLSRPEMISWLFQVF